MKTMLRLSSVVFILILAGLATVQAQEVAINRIPDGQEVKKFKGVVIKRDSDSFTMGETMGGTQTVVLMTGATEVKSHKRGVFRGSKDYGASYVLRGLRLEVDGVGNADGQLVANKIRFDEQDLRTAQALKASVDPVETELRDKLNNSKQNRSDSPDNSPKPRLWQRPQGPKQQAPRLLLTKHKPLPTTQTIALTVSTISIPSKPSLSTSGVAAPYLDQKPKPKLTTPPHG